MRWFLLGLLAALLGLGHDHPAPLAPAPRTPGPLVWWVADRGADRIVGLDRGLFVVRSVELRAPVALAPRRDGLVWVASAAGGRPQGPHRLFLVDPGGQARAQVDLPPLQALVALEGGDALVLVGRGRGTELLRVGEGWRRSLARLPDALLLAARGERVVVAGQGGELWCLGTEPGGALPPFAQGRTGVDPVGLAPGPGEGWWLLDGGRGGRLLLLDGNLQVLQVRPVHLTRPQLARGGGPPWVLDGDRGGVRRLAHLDEPEVAVGDLPVGGFETGWALGDGGLLAAAPGALLGLDRHGRLDHSQGGFSFIADLAPGGVGWTRIRDRR